ncbi:hypothetical protein PHYPO_G00047920 [Pangasianodon hypophthalmus]|uniref:Cadherin domain-containing protein n=1 Tax=Pangasianodon hypophthalmus TaxID=310915 RepID=A0A5N5MGS2_PANHP|nr:hypothetical protein PHYPO_G00047920 [Pangasianodon hypophthalmus]
MGKLDGRGMESSLLLLLTLFATCYSQNVPVINMSVVTVREDLPSGEFAFKIQAYDLDNDPLTYAITLDKNNHFSVSAKLTNEFFPITVSVSDGTLTATKVINVVVQDANDNAPVFQNAPYNIKVPENTPVGTTVLKVTATDPDDGLAGIVSYKIDQAIPVEGLNVFSISQKDGDVVLNEALSFTEKSTFYQLQINASDGGGPLHSETNIIQSSSATAFITIVDIPDLDPQFLNLPNTARVMEHSPVGTSVFKVLARDPDTGINDIINYSIQDASVSGLFQIDSGTGVVTVMADIDREALLDSDAIVKLTVKATEASLNVNGIHANTTSTLDIQIDDVNDQKPLFYKCNGVDCTQTNEFTGEVDEHASVGLSITGLNMTVRDIDSNENSRFRLHLEGTDKDAFSVSPTDDMSDRAVLILIKNPADVDYEKKQTMIVQVVATDAGKPEFVSTATVTIKVNDKNDNSPTFEKDDYKLTVPEHCENGTILDTITATDADALDDGLLTYKLFPESIPFDVFPKNGTVYVKNGEKLDRESKNTYSATLQARDSAGNVGTTVLDITIEDINDQTPQFIRNPYEGFFPENKVLVFQVKAQDDDEPGSPNSIIKYSIEPSEYSSNFTIDENTGEIRSKGPLDREDIDINLKGVITLNVTATDMGTPPLSSTVKFIINVDDENDNSPMFLQTEYTFHVKESERGAFVGYVYATDGDQTEFNNRISFSIKSGSGGTFLCLSELDGTGYRGKILVDPDVELDYESENKKYTLTVEATDLSGNAATCTVYIEVDDVNDTPPILPTMTTFKVEENTPGGTVVGKIVGSDADGNHSLVYELVSTSCHNTTWTPCEEQWFILESSGIVMTAEGITIDYEVYTQVKMTVRVVDLYTEKGRNSTEDFVTIDIIDMDDNEPVFIPVQEFFVLISESIEEGKSVAQVSAKDKDSGDNKKITFKVTLVQFVSNNQNDVPTELDLIFYAETEQPDENENYKGVIRSKNTLEADKQGKYLVTVEAKSLNLSSTEVLELITVDKSYKVGLRFDSTVEEVNVNLPNIRQALTGATKAMVHIVKVSASSSDTTQRKVMTILEAYFVFLNGTALDSDDVGRILNSQSVYEEYGVILQQYGLTGITGNIETTNENNTVLFIMVGLVAGLVIVLIVTTTSLVCIRKKYKTKLKAAKAMNTAAMAATEYQKDGPVVPGTNKYTREGANPVLNLNIDASTDLGFDEEASSADRESLNSLDMDVNLTDKDTVPMMIIEEEEENGDSLYIEPLGAALAQRGKKKGSEGPSFTFTNPSLSTTDL